jgi:hypothetical protein
MGCSSSSAGALIGAPETLGADGRGELVEGKTYNTFLRAKWNKLGQNNGVDKDEPQPELSDIIGSNGRSKLSNQERPHPYQMVLSFPGAAFTIEGGVLTDEDGESFASGHEFVVGFHNWMIEQLGGPEKATQALYFDYHNLKYVPATVACHNYKNRGGTAYLNTNWNFYYVEAQLECKLMVFFITKEWVESKWCLKEFDDLKKLVEMHPRGIEGFADKEMLFYILDPRVTSHENYPKLETEVKAMGGLIRPYNNTMSADEKGAEEQWFLQFAEKYCTEYPVLSNIRQIVSKEATWGDDCKVGGL